MDAIFFPHAFAYIYYTITGLDMGDALFMQAPA